MVDCCIHVGDVVDGILPSEIGHELIYFHGVVGSVANEMIEKLATENVGKNGDKYYSYPVLILNRGF